MTSNLRFWYAGLPQTMPRAERKPLTATLKAAGFAPTKYGFKARIAAVAHASRVKKATGITLEIGKHDYL
jgi:hypothetical protein